MNLSNFLIGINGEMPESSQGLFIKLVTVNLSYAGYMELFRVLDVCSTDSEEITHHSTF